MVKFRVENWQCNNCNWRLKFKKMALDQWTPSISIPYLLEICNTKETIWSERWTFYVHFSCECCTTCSLFFCILQVHHGKDGIGFSVGRVIITTVTVIFVEMLRACKLLMFLCRCHKMGRQKQYSTQKQYFKVKWRCLTYLMRRKLSFSWYYFL